MPADEPPSTPYAVELADEAVYAYACIPSPRTYERIGELIGTLGRFPLLGRVYDPLYRAARPPVECRVLYCEHYGIYYHVDEGRRLVTVLAIEDERMDPLGRFAPLG